MVVELGKAHAGNNMRIYAIGDVHGCLEEMNALLDLIQDDLTSNPIKKHRIIFVGDFVDRGPDCKGVVERLIQLTAENKNITCLFGNHDEKLLHALKPMKEELFKKYFQYGGAETLLSYGFSETELGIVQSGDYSPTLAKALAKSVKKRLPESHIKFLESLPRQVSEGDYFFCHAGVNPNEPFNQQKDHDLIWMREPFLSWDKPLEKVVVHGHTKIDEPDIRVNRINIDTSCVFGEALTAVVLEGTEFRFLYTPALKQYW